MKEYTFSQIDIARKMIDGTEGQFSTSENSRGKIYHIEDLVKSENGCSYRFVDDDDKSPNAVEKQSKWRIVSIEELPLSTNGITAQFIKEQTELFLFSMAVNNIQQGLISLGDIKSNDDDDDILHELAVSIFLNSMEFYAMLVNEQYITSSKIRKFVEGDYQMVYEHFITNNSEYDNNEKIYIEMKKLYKKIKEE